MKREKREITHLVLTSLSFTSNTVCFFEVRFLAALASWLCRLHSFWLFWADQLGKNFGQQFFLAGQGM